MTQPPSVPRSPGSAPSAGYSPSGGKVSPAGLILVFVVVLVIGLALGTAVVVALQPGPKESDCPDPSVPCGAPPVQPTLPPTSNASPTPQPTPASTIVRPSGSLVIPSAAPSGSNVPSEAPPSSAPSVAGNMPQPRPLSNAAPLHAGKVFTSKTFGYSLEYDDQLWAVENQGSTSIALSAGNGGVVIVIEGFKPTTSPQSAVQSKVKQLGDVVLGLTAESDPGRQLPGRPAVGHHQGVGLLLNGTLNSPQGPTSPVDVVVLAATDSKTTIRVTIITDDDLRDAAFAVSDTVLNSILWPTDAE